MDYRCRIETYEGGRCDAPARGIGRAFDGRSMLMCASHLVSRRIPLDRTARAPVLSDELTTAQRQALRRLWDLAGAMQLGFDRSTAKRLAFCKYQILAGRLSG